MSRRAKSPKGNAEAKRPLARKSPKDPNSARVRNLEKRLAEALEQQAATSEILRVISTSATELGPVLDTVAANAARVCDAEDIGVFQLDGDTLRAGGRYGTGPKQDIGSIAHIRRDLLLGRTLLTRRTIHVHDMAAELESEYPGMRSTVERFGMRTMLCTPLLSGGKAVGVIVAVRYEVRPFADKHIRLLETFADQAVIAIENVRLFNETREALEQQTATSEILRVISSSPTDVQPVFNAIAASAARLCESFDALIFRVDGDRLRLVAHHGSIPLGTIGEFTLPLGRGTMPGRSALDGRTIHAADLLAEAEEFPEGSEVAQRMGFRTALTIPLMREGIPIGVIALRRTEVRPFTDRQIALLQTFADQAVIAIENVRLFKELEARNAEQADTLARETATGEVLRAISRAQTDAQPVFDIIAESAQRLCGAGYGQVALYDGTLLHMTAFHNVIPEGVDALRRRFPAPADRGSAMGRALQTRAVVEIPDVAEDPGYAFKSELPTMGFQSLLVVPMLRKDEPIGAIAVGRRERGAFPDKQIELLKTFADQAVIAIENVRMFTELQQKNEALTQAHAQVSESLEQQTATGEILKVISGSPTDVQPVFDTIAVSARHLCDALYSVVFRFEDGMITLVADDGASPEWIAAIRSAYPAPPGRSSVAAQAILERRVIAIADAQSGVEYPHVAARAKAIGYRSIISVPMLRGDTVFGAINVLRTEVLPFNDTQIALLQTFADQAVIAIENVRLFKELEARTHDLTRSVGELRALGEVGQAISSTLDLQTVLSTIVARATQLTGVDAGVIYEYDEQREIFEPRATERLEGDIVQMLVAAPVRKGQGATGRLAEVLEPIQLADLRDIAEQIPVRDVLLCAGYRALLAVPLVREDHLIGGLTVFRKTPGEFAPEVVELLKTFATQSALAIQNARLFLEIEDKSRQLEAASQHKSEFLANMSHELRTPLNAIIGFSEVLTERMFGELNKKQDEYLKDIYASGQHLLSLINDILDLSKIEAGRMELEPTDFDLPSAIDNALILVRERAVRRGIMLGRAIDERVGTVHADERKVKQVLLNLLSNALKFTPEGGRIEVRAAVSDGMVEVSVADTGVGIAPEDQEAVFEEFRQVGTADKKVEGTGLGLALSRKFVELHGGRIGVKSQVGHGSTFTFTIPVRGEPSDRGGAHSLNS